MDLGSILQTVEGLAGPHMAEIGARVGLTPDQVQMVVSHMGQQAANGQTDPMAAAQGTAAHTGIDAGIIQQLMGHLGSAGGAGGAGGLLGSLGGMLGGR